jgi:tetratricopeptide (TPR) repeat protein
MSDLQIVEETLNRTATRARWVRAWNGLWRGLMVGAAVYLLCLAVYKLAPVPWTVVQVGLLAGVGCAVGGLVWGAFRNLSREDAARFLDLRAGLKERLSTALEMSRQGRQEQWAELIIADAGVAARNVDPRRVLPFELPRLARWLVLTLALGAGLGFVPEYRSKTQVQAAADSAIIKDAGRNLVQVTKREVAERKPALEQTRKAMEDVEQLGDRLQSAKLTRDDALKDLAKATENLKQQAMELAKNPALRKLEQAARNSGSTPNQTPASLQKQLDSLQKALGDKANQSDAIKDMQKDLQKLQEAAKGLADKSGAEADQARQEMAKALSELSRQAAAMDMPMESLADAAEALRNADVGQFMKDLGLAEKDLEKLAEMAQQLAQLQQQAEKIGKDLAEQLKNGQAEAAADTLRQMIDQLKLANLSPEQMAKIAEEAAKASKAGDQYGKVGDLLRKAADQAKAGDRKGGAESLAAAQKELQELMEQMGDAQAMMASLQALQKAQMCIGNGQCWSQVRNPNGSPKAGKGSKGGKGVGTWSDNDAWSMPEGIDDLWDNSGINRPDMEGKGLTERDINHPEGLVPTKVKGQMQPGGPMPSITLRGVSAKGESRVQYAEAVASAQSDAQAALNQEEVPKAYKNAVRDYFDDIKK